MAFTSLDFLACVVAAWPPFSVVLTVWLSIIAALGSASRPIEVRNCSRKAVLTRSQVLSVTEQENILDTEKWLQYSIRVRNPYVDPLNYIQIALLSRLRREDNLDEKTRDEIIRILANSVNGIAAGLQNVG